MWSLIQKSSDLTGQKEGTVMKKKGQIVLGICTIIAMFAGAVILFLTPATPFPEGKPLDITSVMHVNGGRETDVSETVDPEALAAALRALSVERFPSYSGGIPLTEVSYEIRVICDGKPYDIYVGKEDYCLVGHGGTSLRRIRHAHAWSVILQHLIEK
ncbi:MAG: hypothetical protein IJM26_04305 [Lachnospiraceae bacterium]|nr:hypothetical protein [Lachnospiraceae bacterium]